MLSQMKFVYTLENIGDEMLVEKIKHADNN